MFVNLQGKTFAHESSITRLLEVVNLPKEVEIIHVRRHQAGYSEETTGNRVANGEVQKAALVPEVSGILLLLPVARLSPGEGGRGGAAALPTRGVGDN